MRYIPYKKCSYSLFLLLCLIVLPFSVQAENWSEGFSSGDRWTFDVYSVGNSYTKMLEQDHIYLYEEQLVFDPTELESYHLHAYTESDVAYGTWQWDMNVNNAQDTFTFMMNDPNTDMNWNGKQYSEIDLEGYGLQVFGNKSGLLDGPGLIFWKFVSGYSTPTQRLADIIIPEGLNGSHSFAITRELDGNMTAYVDGKKVLSVVDNEYTTSTYLGISSFRGRSMYDNIFVTEGQVSLTNLENLLENVEPVDIVILAGIILSLTGMAFYLRSYFRSNSINEAITEILEPLFKNNISLMLLLLGVRQQKTDAIAKLESEIPDQIYDYKYLFNPVRLSILKLLSENVSLQSNELRDKLGVNYNDFRNHLNSLHKKNYVIIENQFIDGTLTQIISLSPTSLAEFNTFRETLMTFLDTNLI